MIFQGNLFGGTAAKICHHCGRPIHDIHSQRIGLGQMCRLIFGIKDQDIEAHCEWDDLFIDCEPLSVSFVCYRVDGGRRSTNIEHLVMHHTPAGFAWGTLNEGCLDLAMNLVEHFVRELELEDAVQNFSGKTRTETKGGASISMATHKIYVDFAQEHLVSLPNKGGRIDTGLLRAFVKTRANALVLAQEVAL